MHKPTESELNRLHKTLFGMLCTTDRHLTILLISAGISLETALANSDVRAGRLETAFADRHLFSWRILGGIHSS